MRHNKRHDRLIREVPGGLAALLGVAQDEVTVGAHEAGPVDLVLEAGRRTFVAEVKTSARTGAVVDALRLVQAYAREEERSVVPLVVVTFMGPVGRQLCEEAGCSWMDLSGNGHINTSGLQIRVEGKPNRYNSAGRPASVFAPKSSRVARWLLMHPGEPIHQRDLARSTEVDEGHLSRIVRRLEADRLVARDGSGRLVVPNPDLLLDVWKEAYSFSKHEMLRGHVPARSGEALVRQLSEGLSTAQVEHAATGLGAAWFMTGFAAFRLATFYIQDWPADDLLSELGFREEERGANTWLVLPNDEGVFQGAKDWQRIRCVHPVQAFLDLQEHPERSAEAAGRMRSELLSWSANA